MYWPIRITGVIWSMNLACSPYLCSRASCPTGTLYQECSEWPKSCCIAYWRILRDHQSIHLTSGINDFLRCQRLNRHGLRMKTLSCIIYVFIYVHELVNLEVPRRTPSRTRCRLDKKPVESCFQGESVSTQSRNAHLDLQLVASLNWVLIVKLSLGARYEARDVKLYNSNLAYVFTTREEFWSQSVGFKSARMQLIWVSFTSEYLQVNVVHLSANEIRCPSQQPLFYSWQ